MRFPSFICGSLYQRFLFLYILFLVLPIFEVPVPNSVVPNFGRSCVWCFLLLRSYLCVFLSLCYPVNGVAPCDSMLYCPPDSCHRFSSFLFVFLPLHFLSQFLHLVRIVLETPRNDQRHQKTTRTPEHQDTRRDWCHLTPFTVYALLVTRSMSPGLVSFILGISRIG